MEGTHRKVGSRPFMPDPTLTCLCSALLGHIAKLGSITHPKQRRATIPDRILVYAFTSRWLFPVSVSVLTAGLHSPQ